MASPSHTDPNVSFTGHLASADVALWDVSFALKLAAARSCLFFGDTLPKLASPALVALKVVPSFVSGNPIGLEVRTLSAIDLPGRCCLYFWGTFRPSVFLPKPDVPCPLNMSLSGGGRGLFPSLGTSFSFRELSFESSSLSDNGAVTAVALSSLNRFSSSSPNTLGLPFMHPTCIPHTRGYSGGLPNAPYGESSYSSSALVSFPPPLVF